MKTRSKLSILPLTALVVGCAMALAANFPVKQTQTWTRKGGPASNNWQAGALPGCVSSSGICQAEFPDDYDPNDHNETDNQEAASVTINGYVP
jgi:hypothetical protein